MKVEEYLNRIDYGSKESYIPSDFALEFVNFIKLVNGEGGEENLTPVLHFKMLDTIVRDKRDVVNMLFRGAAKTSLMEYLLLYIGTYGEIPDYMRIPLAMYVSDSIENGVKNMRKNLEHRYENSEFLQYYIPEIKFTDVRWEFTNRQDSKFICKGYGANALPLDTILHTETGTTTIKDVRIGDKIIGADGKLHTVSVKSSVFNRPVYRINLADGRSLDVCEEHINNVIINTNPNNTVRLEEKNLSTLELLKEPLTHTKQGNKKHRGTSSKSLISIKNVQAIQYETKELPIDPYTLGLLLGDGSLKIDGSNVIHAHKDDAQVYLKYIPYRIGSKYLDKRNKNVLSFSLLDIFSEVASLGLRGIRMNKKFIPPMYFYGSIEQRKALLAGLLDTDGCVTKNGRIEFVNTSRQLTKDVVTLTRSLGGTATLRDAFIKGKHKDGGFNRQDAYKAEIWLADLDIVRLPRKILRLTQNLVRSRWLEKGKRVAIESIMEIPQVPTQCIGIESDDCLFVAGEGYVVTHNTGVRGAKEMGTRPVLAILDDLVSDDTARSPTVMASIEDTVYKAVDYALHPKNRKILWSGTPFNAKDPLYKAAESDAWVVNVYPVCDTFPCAKKDFRGAWEDRFPYEYVMDRYKKALKLGKIDTFNQEMMLRIMSDEDRLIKDSEILWFKRKTVLENKQLFNFYITTDFATSEKESADYSVISVWAYNNIGDWLWVDGICTKQTMDKNVNDLFRLSQEYSPQQVGIEISGQQKGFVSWVQSEMLNRNIHFPLASDNNDNNAGIRPNTQKMVRFNVIVPLFKTHKIFFPTELKEHPAIIEALDELGLVSSAGMKSKHDDFCDTISMLASLTPWKPSQVGKLNKDSSTDLWDIEQAPEIHKLSSYIV